MKNQQKQQTPEIVLPSQKELDTVVNTKVEAPEPVVVETPKPMTAAVRKGHTAKQKALAAAMASTAIWLTVLLASALLIMQDSISAQQAAIAIIPTTAWMGIRIGGAAAK